MIVVADTVPSEWYNNNQSKRKDYSDRAEKIADISLPYVIRTDGASGSDAFKSAPAQSFNGRLINNLKSIFILNKRSNIPQRTPPTIMQSNN